MFWQAANCPSKLWTWLVIGWLLLGAVLWLSSLHFTTILYCKQASLHRRHFKPSSNQNYIYTIHNTWAVYTAGYKQARWCKKQHYLSSSSPLPLTTYNKCTNMIKESPLQFLLTLKLSHETTFSINDVQTMKLLSFEK